MWDFTDEELKMSGARRIASYYRTRILNGTFPAGTKLPSTHELAEELTMSAANLQRAFSALVNEGLIERKPHYGTIVKAIKSEFRFAAIIVFVSKHAGIPAYQRVLMEEIIRELHRRNYEALTIHEDMDHPDIERVRQLIRKLGVQGIIPLSAPKEVFHFVKQINLPAATDSLMYSDCRVIFDLMDYSRLIPPTLRQMGCRRPGLLLAFSEPTEEPDDEYMRYCRKCLSALNAAITAAGMELRPEWVRRFGNMRAYTDYEYNRDAYLLTKQLFSSHSDCPDGLFVYSDVVIPGVTQGLLESGMRPDSRLRLILHRNREIKIFTPFPYAVLENSLNEKAAALVDMLLRQFHGQKIRPVLLHHRIDLFPNNG